MFGKQTNSHLSKSHKTMNKKRLISISCFDAITGEEMELESQFVPTPFDLNVGDFVNIMLRDKDFNQYSVPTRDMSIPVYKREYDTSMGIMYYYVRFDTTHRP